MQLDRVRVIAEMASQRVSVKELAERSGLSRASITSVRGGKSCSTATGKSIAYALGVDIEELLEKNKKEVVG